jgi:3-hydroxyisobutyrate dehydrogenase-like beta-hydroxyacid dehydrogenase
VRCASVGLGQMGVRMAAHVAAAGHTLTVCDVQPDRTARVPATSSMRPTSRPKT